MRWGLNRHTLYMCVFWDRTVFQVSPRLIHLSKIDRRLQPTWAQFHYEKTRGDIFRRLWVCQMQSCGFKTLKPWKMPCVFLPVFVRTQWFRGMRANLQGLKRNDRQTLQRCYINQRFKKVFFNIILRWSFSIFLNAFLCIYCTFLVFCRDEG